MQNKFDENEQMCYIRDIKKIIVHCTASQDSLDIGFKEINSWHRDRGFLSDSGISCGYHYIIRRDGRIERGRPDHEMGAHCYGHNHDSIGVVWVGIRSPSDAQMQAIPELLRSLIKKYNVDYTEIHGHSQFNSNKTCPVIDMDFIRCQTLFARGEINVDEI